MKLLLILLLLVAGLRAQVPTLQDFGYESIQRIGRPVRGTVPLLALTVQLTGYPALTHTPAYWDQLIYPFSGPGGTVSLNGYYAENSLGAFYFTRALVTSPPALVLNAAETSQIMTPGYDSPGGRAAMFSLITAKTGLNWSQWDTNADGQVTQGELCILILTNFVHPDPDFGNREGHARPLSFAAPGPLPFTVTTLNLMVTLVANRASFATIVHELTHCLGVDIDLYADGNQNNHLTLMGATVFAPVDDRRTFHLDPWYKMRLGWLRPRIFDLDAGGLVTLRCPQSPFAQIEAEGPVILYSASRGSSEYFMLEWRNAAPPAGGKYDSSVELANGMNGRGIAVWHVRQNASHAPVLLLGGRLWSAYHMSAPAPALRPDNSPNPAVFFNRGSFNLGGWVLWDTTTPALEWDDLTSTAVRVQPGAILEGGNAIRVEWLSSAEKWADFFSSQPAANGTFANPWQTIATAAAGTPRGGTLNFKSSSTPTGIIIDKPMLLRANHNGSVIIGQ